MSGRLHLGNEVGTGSGQLVIFLVFCSMVSSSRRHVGSFPRLAWKAKAYTRALHWARAISSFAVLSFSSWAFSAWYLFNPYRGILSTRLQQPYWCASLPSPCFSNPARGGQGKIFPWSSGLQEVGLSLSGPPASQLCRVPHRLVPSSPAAIFPSSRSSTRGASHLLLSNSFSFCGASTAGLRTRGEGAVRGRPRLLGGQAPAPGRQEEGVFSSRPRLLSGPAGRSLTAAFQGQVERRAKECFLRVRFLNEGVTKCSGGSTSAGAGTSAGLCHRRDRGWEQTAPDAFGFPARPPPPRSPHRVMPAEVESSRRLAGESSAAAGPTLCSSTAARPALSGGPATRPPRNGLVWS